MFKILKKKKNQVVENVGMNQNVSENSNSIFPNAKDTLETVKQKWKTITPDEILQKINSRASEGNRDACFFDSYISKELIKELRSQGYSVTVFGPTSKLGPCFMIEW